MTIKVGISAKANILELGGNSRYSRELASGLPKFGIEPFVSILRRDLPRMARTLIESSVEGFIARHSACDVMHYTSDTGALLKQRLPVVATIHGHAGRYFPVRSPLRERMWRARVGRLAALAHTIITDSRSSAGDLVASFGVDGDRIHVVPLGVDHRRFRAARNDAEIEAARREAETLDLPERFFLYVGNIDPRKNVDGLVDAAKEVNEATGIPTLIAGANGWGCDTLYGKLLAGMLPGVRYVGRPSDAEMLRLLWLAEAFVFPSRYEGFGLPVLEAMAAGTPVICTHNGSLAEVAGSSCIVTTTDAGTIAQSMKSIAGSASLARELVALGLANAATYTWEMTCSQHAMIYRSVLS